MPARLADDESQQSAPYPEGKENVRRNAPIKIEKAPRQEEEWQGVGHQMAVTAMYQRMGKDAEHTPLLARVDTQPAEVPIHARLQKFQQIEHEQQEAGKCGCQADPL